MVRKQFGRLTAVFIPFILIITACATAAAPVQEAAAPTIPPAPTVEVLMLPDLGQAPEITNDVWINADTPVTLASQQGKAVLIEFWTFG